MRCTSLVGLMFVSCVCIGGVARADDLPEQFQALPAMAEATASPARGDWLVVPVDRKTSVYRSGPRAIAMTNGLIRRVWQIEPNGATVAFDNQMTGESMLRGVKPEARLRLNGKDYDVGGLKGQPNYAYLRPEWLNTMTADPAAFRLIGIETGETKERFAWKRVRHAAKSPWPSPGASLSLHFQAPAGTGLDGLTVLVHYEMYDGIPLLCKWLTLRNDGRQAVRLNRFTSEILAVVEDEPIADARGRCDYARLHVENDYSFCGPVPRVSRQGVFWSPDPQYTTQVDYDCQTPNLLECRPIGPDVIVDPGATFESFRTFELVYDSTDRERRGLALRRMYRTIAPWVTENPIFMHVTRHDPPSVKLAVDQCAEVGFEMVVLSFNWSNGPKFNIERQDRDYLQQIKELVDYAKAKGIELGGYSLLSSRTDTGAGNEVVDAATGRPGGAIFGQAPCLCSRWGIDYFRKLPAFFKATGLNMLEHDGSYAGDRCASTVHPGHHGLDDSQWRQWEKISGFYKWCRGQGIYLNVPDAYFLVGSSKTGMGYRETNWSLPRDQQIIHARQNIYDGTWDKTPSMGWMFVPLVQYHGGGAAATLEPLAEHLPDYEAHLANLFGSGVQAAYRGPRLHDGKETKTVVKKWVDFYKRHREILDSDLIHVRRADARDVDCLLHVNPRLSEKGLVMVYNPLERPAKTTLQLPLYYTGLTRSAAIRREDGPPTVYKLDRTYHAELPIAMAPHSVTWFVIEAASDGLF
ncbi:MAG: hypothetical protein ABFC63_01070 [Thermoguttaceae bacterium]